MATRFIPYKAAIYNYAYSVVVALLEEESALVVDDSDVEEETNLAHGSSWYAAFGIPIYKTPKYKTVTQIKEVPIILLVEPADQVQVTVIGYPEKATSQYEYKIRVEKTSGRTKVSDSFDCLISKSEFNRLLPSV